MLIETLSVSLTLGLDWRRVFWHPLVHSLAPSSLWFSVGLHQKHCRPLSFFSFIIESSLSLTHAHYISTATYFLWKAWEQSTKLCERTLAQDVSLASSMRQEMEDTKDNKRKETNWYVFGMYRIRTCCSEWSESRCKYRHKWKTFLA